MNFFLEICSYWMPQIFIPKIKFLENSYLSRKCDWSYLEPKCIFFPSSVSCFSPLPPYHIYALYTRGHRSCWRATSLLHTEVARHRDLIPHWSRVARSAKWRHLCFFLCLSGFVSTHLMSELGWDSVFVISWYPCALCFRFLLLHPWSCAHFLSSCC